MVLTHSRRRLNKILLYNTLLTFGHIELLIKVDSLHVIVSLENAKLDEVPLTLSLVFSLALLMSAGFNKFYLHLGWLEM